MSHFPGVKEIRKKRGLLFLVVGKRGGGFSGRLAALILNDSRSPNPRRPGHRPLPFPVPPAPSSARMPRFPKPQRITAPRPAPAQPGRFPANPPPPSAAGPGITHGREPVRSFRYPHLKPGSLPVRPGFTDSYSRDLKNLAREAQVKPLLP